MLLSIIASVIIGLTIYETLYYLLIIILEKTKQNKIDQEALDYLEQTITETKQQNSNSNKTNKPL
jgi:hypothetical protein